MGEIYSLESFRGTRYSNREEADLTKIENALCASNLLYQNKWKEFQSILLKAGKESTYWRGEKTQKELIELCANIDVRIWDFEEKYGLQDYDGRFHSFLKNIKDEDFNASWDSTYFQDFWKQDALVEEMVPLYPKDVFAFFILLDRVILFYQEEKRRIKYEKMWRGIKDFNLSSIEFSKDLKMQSIGDSWLLEYLEDEKMFK